MHAGLCKKPACLNIRAAMYADNDGSRHKARTFGRRRRRGHINQAVLKRILKKARKRVAKSGRGISPDLASPQPTAFLLTPATWRGWPPSLARQRA